MDQSKGAMYVEWRSIEETMASLGLDGINFVGLGCDL
jgi:hypothetical protein